MKTSTIIFWLAATALSGCSDTRPEADPKSDNRPDTELVEGLRGLYPGDAAFGDYSPRIVSRGGEIVPELIEASKDADSRLRESAARCLGKIATDEAVTRLIEMTSDDEIEHTIWIALSYAASPKAIPALQAESGSHSDARSRGRLLITLAECGDESQLSALLKHMKTHMRTPYFEGHIYGANRVFEKLAGKRFNNDTQEIEKWLRKRNA